MVKQSKGFCKYCGKEYTKSGMLRHLAACSERMDRINSEETKVQRGYYQIVITGKYDKNYWLIIEINENASLKDLDQFLRDIWLECCGHLSAFEIDGIRYEIFPNEDCFWGEPAKNMNHKIKDVLFRGEKFAYEYDFGSSTDLLLSVHSYRIGSEKRREKIVILSRNNPPEILCGQCGINKASWIEVAGIYRENPFWCEACLKDADMECLLPVCNSPRMGVCGYEGSVVYPEQFEPDSHGTDLKLGRKS